MGLGLGFALSPTFGRSVVSPGGGVQLAQDSLSLHPDRIEGDDFQGGADLTEWAASFVSRFSWELDTAGVVGDVAFVTVDGRRVLKVPQSVNSASRVNGSLPLFSPKLQGLWCRSILHLPSTLTALSAQASENGGIVVSESLATLIATDIYLTIWALNNNPQNTGWHAFAEVNPVLAEPIESLRNNTYSLVTYVNSTEYRGWINGVKIFDVAVGPFDGYEWLWLNMRMAVEGDPDPDNNYTHWKLFEWVDGSVNPVPYSGLEA